MKIIDILNSGKVTVSCELFPPKHGSELPRAKAVVRETAELRPSFISITCGAGGDANATVGGRTASLASEAQNAGVTALAHLTCISSGQDSVKSVLKELASMGIENILALRGDIPEGQAAAAGRHYSHACDLMKEIRDFREGGKNFCVGGACYPEGHPESPTLQHDIENMKIKVDSGCQFLTTQMFFDNNVLYNYMYRLLKNGVNVPVVAGIMPVTDGRQMTRICKLSGTALPPRFRAIVDRFADSPAAMVQAGAAYAAEQIIDLVANGIRNIHIYTMNKPVIAKKIMDNLSEIFV